MPDDLRDQFPIVREIIGAFGIPIYQLQGFEADDLIAALVRQAEERDVSTTIVSGDLDLLQLVSDRTTLMTTRGGVQQTAYYDPAKVMERYGLRPEQMIDFKALKGDTTDNIPGIAGVGEKTAAKLVQDYGSVDGIYADLDAVTPEKLRLKLAEHRDDVFRWRELVTVRADAADRARSRAGAAGRLRPPGGAAPLPRVRVPLARRAAAGHDRRGRARAGRPAARGGPQRADPGGPGRRPTIGGSERDGGRQRRRDAAQPRLSAPSGATAAAAAVDAAPTPRRRSESAGRGAVEIARPDHRAHARRLSRCSPIPAVASASRTRDGRGGVARRARTS